MPKIIKKITTASLSNKNKIIYKKKTQQHINNDFQIIQSITNKKGQIRIGRKVGNNIPQLISFIPIIVIMKSHSKKWYPLSPYALKNKANQIMENIWQSAKVYKNIPKSTQYYSRYQRRIIWEHEAEIHVDNNNEKPNDKYWA